MKHPHRYKYISLLSIIIPILFVISFLPVTSYADDSTPFISEYVEGSSYNKALEIFNPTDQTIDLDAENYSIAFYYNGNTSAGLTIDLVGTLPANGVFILAHYRSHADILAVANQTNNASWFNGDDTIVLLHGTDIIDHIGQIGFDPGSEWGSGLTSTENNTLIRNPDVYSGDIAAGDPFDPSIQWTGYVNDYFSDLGVHDTTTYYVHLRTG